MNVHGQVIEADSSIPAHNRSYQYDAIGNRKKSADNLTLPGADNYVSNALNQYTALDSLNPSCDDDGNAIAYPVPAHLAANSTLVWDGENRLVSATVNSITTTYLYDAQSRCITTTPVHHYPTYDGNGNVSEYLDEAGAVAAHYEYDPFGRILVATGAKANDFAHRFSTKPLDEATGLYYYGYRYYDPETGRWPSRDPMRELGGKNIYTFTLNQPVNTIDRLGLNPLLDILNPDGPVGGSDFDPNPDPPNPLLDIFDVDNSSQSLPSPTNTGTYICRKRRGSDGSSQEGPYEESGDGSGCCLNGRCSYDCTAVEGGEQDPEGVPIEFKFKICGKEKDQVDNQSIGNQLSYFCPDTIELNMSTYRNGTYSTNDVPMGSPPRNIGIGNQ